MRDPRADPAAGCDGAPLGGRALGPREEARRIFEEAERQFHAGNHHTASLRKPIMRVMKRAGIDRRQTTPGFRRTFNNLVRQFATGDVLRAMTGHVTEAMTFHYSHIEVEEKRAAVDLVVASMGSKVEGQVEGRSADAKSTDLGKS